VTTVHAHNDADRITVDQAYFGSRTIMFGGADNSGTTGPLDGEDRFVVEQLASMDVARGHTLTFDGGSNSDVYVIVTHGSLNPGGVQ
jgi:hypothetical protein